MALLTGTLSNDTLKGTNGDDSLYGYAGNDYLYGYGGNDRLYGGIGIDTMYGGLGNDWYFVDSYSDVTKETSASGGYDTVFSTVSRTLGSNLEKLVLQGTTAINGKGNSLGNRLYGNSANNKLYGYFGNDYLYGYAGNDYLNGGLGNDRLNGGPGIDTMVGGSGNDWYFVDRYADVTSETSASGGYDTIYSTVSRILGNYQEKLVLQGTSAINGKGNSLNNQLIGNSAKNYLFGYVGNDYLSGGSGNDILNGGAGNDTMYGGDGDDIYNVDSGSDTVIENLGEGTDKVCSAISYTLGDNLENLQLYGTDTINGNGNILNNHIIGNTGNNDLIGHGGDDIIEGGEGNDRLYGSAGSDTLYGGIGDDILYGNAGADIMEGGPGDDRYWVQDITDVVTETSSNGYDRVSSSITYTLGGHLERLELSGTATINGTGNSLDNYITGNSGENILSGLAGNDSLYGDVGNDSLYGGDGNDFLHGGTGNDTMEGGAGDDHYYVDSNSDIVTEKENEGSDEVHSSISYILGDHLENLTLIGTAAIDGTGNSLDNQIDGNSGNNILTGGSGNDTINGYSGNDTMIGGVGDDSYWVDNGSDVVIEIVNEGEDTVFSRVSYTLGDHLERLYLAGTDVIDATGNSLDNYVVGNNENNILNGGDGNDIIVGNSGNDTLLGGDGIDWFYGNDGADTFVFDTPLSSSANRDRIVDFSGVGGDGDRIHLDDDIFTVFTSTGTLSSDNYRSSSGGTAADSNDYILYNTDSGILFYDADGNGSGVAVEFGILTNQPAVSYSDFMVVD